MIIRLVIDRFEGKYAILETQDKIPLAFNFPPHLLPPNTEEGSVLRSNIDIDIKETTIKRNKLLEKLSRLKKKDKGRIFELKLRCTNE